MRYPEPPNPSVNADAPVRVFNSASPCGGAPVTLIRKASQNGVSR